MLRSVLILTISGAITVIGAAVDKKDVEYARPGGKAVLLDLHVPDGPGPFPAAILVHGGGFDQGSKSTNVRPLFDPLTDAGYAWFSIDYRMAPEFRFPEAIEDLNSAIRWLKSNAAAYHVDAAKIVLIGESAGGFLVNYAGTHETPDTKVAAVVDIYGPVDYGKLAELRRDHPEHFNMVSINRHAANGGGIRFFGAEKLDETGLAKLRTVSPIFGVHKGMPPFLCIHGTKDDQVVFEQSTAMCDTMHQAGAVCELITIEGGGHGMSGWKAPDMQHWKPEMIAWLQKTLSGPVQLTSQEDQQRLAQLLHITALRRGADGRNKDAANYANYDESKANPYPELPDPLVLKNGKKVKTAKAWWSQRRPEIVEDFDREIYGRVPKDTPKVNWEVTHTKNETNGGVPVITKELTGHVDNSSYPQVTVDIKVVLSTPANASGPVPVMLEFGFVAPRPGGAPGAPPRLPPAPAGPTWQQQVLAKGWGYAILAPNSVQADNGAGLTQGIIGLVNKGQPRKLDDWGALRAWAWGASRVLDYFETDKAVDAKQVGVDGHSRYGKATVVAMAYDSRFAIAYVSSSGEGGVKLHRRNWGELVENVAGANEYHWMAGNFLKYAGPLKWSDMPVDSHELVALCAPRPVFIGAGATEGDGWVDAKGMFLAAAGAGSVYKLLGKKDLGTTEFPPIETALVDGDVAFRQHSGGHTPGPNWPTFIAFAERYFKSAPPTSTASRQ